MMRRRAATLALALVGLAAVGALVTLALPTAALADCCNCRDNSQPLVPPVHGLDFANVCLPATGPAPTCDDHSDPIDHCGPVNSGWSCRPDPAIEMVSCQPPITGAPALSHIPLAGLGVLLVGAGIWLTRKRTRPAA
jgi:hypothetical protein